MNEQTESGEEAKQRVRDALSDASLYINQKHVDAGLEILAEEEHGFAAFPELAMAAMPIVNTAFLYYTRKDVNNGTAAARAIDHFFRLATYCEPAVRSLKPHLLDNYKRALLVTTSSATPLRRVFRQTSLVELFEKSIALDGAVAECGCARGMSSMQLAFAISNNNAGWRGERFHILDSFRGLSEPSALDLDTSGMDTKEAARVMQMTRAGAMSYPYEEISRIMWGQFPELSLHRGWIPSVFDGLLEERYRFVHVDVDLYEPTLASFEYFYPRLVSGGMIVTDDYNWPGGRRAVDEFCIRNGVSLNLTHSKLAYLVAP
jgi:O-methyltransferase